MTINKTVEKAFDGFKVVYQPPNGTSINEATRRKAIEIASLALVEQSNASDKIADAVISWMVKYDLLDAGNEYQAEDILAVLEGFVPKCDKPVATMTRYLYGQHEQANLNLKNIEAMKLPHGTYNLYIGE